MFPGRRHKYAGMDTFWGKMAYEPIIPVDLFASALKQRLDWEDLGAKLVLVHEGRGEIGRPSQPRMMIFELLFLSYLFGLSGRDSGRFATAPPPARHFLDMAVNEPAPDHTSLSMFGSRLIDAEAQAQLAGVSDGQVRQFIHDPLSAHRDCLTIALA